MNKYSKLSKDQMLNICKLINTDCEWEFNQILDNDGKGTDDCYQFLGEDEYDYSYIFFYIHRPEEDEIKCYLNGNWYYGEIPVDKIEQVNDFLGIETVIKKQDTNANSNANSNPIKKHYVLGGKIDKFTKIAEYEMRPYLTLDVGLFRDHVKVTSDRDIGNSKMRMDTIYRHRNEEDILIIRVTLEIDTFGLKNILKDAKVFFLLDDNETIQTGEVLDYVQEKTFRKVGRFGITSLESTYLEADFAFLSKLAFAKKIEYRVSSEIGKVSEGKLNKSDLLKLKGFYNSLFDPEFMKDELIEQIEEERIEEERKKNEEHEKINNNDQKILEFCKQGKKLEAVKFRKEISGSDLATSKKYVEELCDQNGIKVEPKSSSNCFVITATMGDPYHPIVNEFRAYRDQKLLTNSLGKAFVSFYYKVGPYLASIISKSEVLRKLSFSIFVNPIYKRLKNDRNTNKN
jgi:hypothetical protein